jgi:hypothetical protein
MQHRAIVPVESILLNLKGFLLAHYFSKFRYQLQAISHKAPIWILCHSSLLTLAEPRLAYNPSDMKLLTEKFVEKKIVEYLSRKGWGRNLRTHALDEHGVDMKVRHNKYARYWLVEVKGDAGPGAKHPNSVRETNFVYGVGQIISRMHRSGKPGYKYGYKYGVGFPAGFRSKVLRRIPFDVCHKLNLYFFFVDLKGKVELLDWKVLKKEQTKL